MANSYVWLVRLDSIDALCILRFDTIFGQLPLLFRSLTANINVLVQLIAIKNIVTIVLLVQVSSLYYVASAQIYFCSIKMIPSVLRLNTN